VVLVTSTSVDEGKTFFAANFASVYALTGKKALFVCFDFRSPGILEEFNLNPDIGITSHLVNDLEIEQVVQKTFTKNLDILLTGPIPPNPDELIESEKTKQMFQYLRHKYNYIIVDTPPIGVFGDAFLLNKYSDATLFIVRHNFTRKREFVAAINEAISNQMKHLSIVYNDAEVKLKERDIKIYGEEAPQSFFLIELVRKFRNLIINVLRKI
jgi:capsular exopolysaccharide synthesis family protein